MLDLGGVVLRVTGADAGTADLADIVTHLQGGDQSLLAGHSPLDRQRHLVSGSRRVRCRHPAECMPTASVARPCVVRSADESVDTTGEQVREGDGLDPVGEQDSIGTGVGDDEPVQV